MGSRQSLTRQKTSLATTDEPAREDGQLVVALERGMAVLNACVRAAKPVGNGDLAAMTGLSAPTVSRIAYTLYRGGYLEFLPRERMYVPGGRAIGLAAMLMRQIDVRALARPGMEALARDAHFNVGLGTLEGSFMVYLDVFEGDALVGLRLRAGSHVPVLTSAMGRAYLAAASDTARDALLDLLRPRYGDEWPSVVSAARQASQSVTEDGFCLSIGDWHKDINGIAAPLIEPSTGRIFVLNLGGPAYMLPEKLLRDTLAPRLLGIIDEARNKLAIDTV